MIFYMTASVFQDIYLNNEDDKDILDADYLLLSSRIYLCSDSLDNVMIKPSWRPDYQTCMATDVNDFYSRYKDQLNKSQNFHDFMSKAIQFSIVHNSNLILLTTDIENQYNVTNGHIDFLKLIGDYTYEMYKYPVYDYKQYALRKCDLIPYDVDKVMEICDKHTKALKKVAANRVEQELLHRLNIAPDMFTEKYIEENVRKKSLKSILKNHGISTKDMDKLEMFELIKDYFSD